MICGDSLMQAGQADYKWFCNSVSACVPLQLDTAALAAKRSGKQILSFSHQVLPPGALQYTPQRKGSQQGLKRRALLIWIIVSRCYVQEQVGWVDSGQRGRVSQMKACSKVVLMKLLFWNVSLRKITKIQVFYVLSKKAFLIFFKVSVFQWHEKLLVTRLTIIIVSPFKWPFFISHPCCEITWLFPAAQHTYNSRPV